MAVLSRAVFLVFRAVINFLKIIGLAFQVKFKKTEVLKLALYYFKDVIAANLMIGVIMGVVIGIQIGPEFTSRGLGSSMGILSALVMSRELMPVVGSLMIATQYGTGLASEIANMKISDQIDALKIQQIDPVSFIALPRFLAAIITSPIIIWFSTVISVLSTYLVVNITSGQRFASFMSTIENNFMISDLLLCLTKSAVFSALIIVIAYTLGIETRGGAKEVGKATTLTVINSFVLILIFDYFITAIYL